MFSFSVALVLVAFALVINGLSLQYSENGKMCTTWMPVTSEPVNVDSSSCSSSLDYEIKSNNNQYIIRFCCTYKSVTQPPVGPTPKGCGRQAVTPIRTRIVGGREAVANSWPWLVSLQFEGNHFCGGTLIDEYHVLTAAHCLQDKSMFNSRLTVVAGLHSRSRPNPQTVQRRQVSVIINHPSYNDNTYANDIAIMRLAQPMTLTNFVNIACLPGPDPPLNANVMIAGWGTTSYDGDPSDTLLQAGIVIMDLCTRVYNFDSRAQICAGNHQYNKDACQGDSGGPLMYEANGQWTVSGVVSYGDECAKVYRPGVYTRVKYYIPWIQNIIAALSGK